MDADANTLLAASARDGDREAFATLVRRHYTLVYGVAYSAVGNWTAAEDIAQDTFLTAWVNLTRLRTPAAFVTWLQTIARNLSKNWWRSMDYRKRLLERHLAEAPSDSQAEDPRTTLAREERQDSVWEALRTLSPNLREAVVLFYIEGRSTSETARTLGISENAAKLRLSHARAKLRGYLEARLDERLGRLRSCSTADAQKRILAGLAVGPVLPALGSSVTGGAWSVALQRILTDGVATMAKPLLTGGIVMTAKKGVVVCLVLVALVGAGVYLALPEGSTSQERAKVAKSGIVDGPLPQPAGVQGTSSTSQPSQGASTPAVPAPKGTAFSEVDLLKAGTPCAVSGMVVDKAANAVPGAVVTLFTTAQSRNEWTDRLNTVELMRDRRRYFETTSDGLGNFRLTNVPYAGYAMLTASRDGAIGNAFVNLTGGQTRENIVVIVSEAFTLTGKVVDDHEAPVTDALVVGGDGYFVRRTALTDGDGLFSLHFQVDKPKTLAVSSEKHGRSTFHGIPVQSEPPVILRLTQPASLAGTVKWADGAPAQGLRVVLHGETEGSVYGDESFYETSESFGIVGSDGRYDIAGIDVRQDYRVQVRTAADKEVTDFEGLKGFASGETLEWNRVVERTIVVSGRVVGATTGRPLNDVEVFCRKAGDASPFPERAQRGADGAYELRIVEGPGTYFVYPGCRLGSGQGNGIPEDAHELELEWGDERQLDLSLPEPVTVSVRVVDPEGRPIAGADISAERRHSVPAMNWISGNVGATDADGRFVYSGFDADTPVFLSATCAGYAGGGTPVVSGTPGDDIEQTIVLYPSAGIEGIVTDAEGNPLTNAHVNVRAVCGNGAPSPRLIAQTDEDGAFTISTGVPATSVSLEMSVMTRAGGPQIYTHVSQDAVQCTAANITNIGQIVCEPITEDMIANDASGWTQMVLGRER